MPFIDIFYIVTVMCALSSMTVRLNGCTQSDASPSLVLLAESAEMSVSVKQTTFLQLKMRVFCVHSGRDFRWTRPSVLSDNRTRFLTMSAS